MATTTPDALTIAPSEFLLSKPMTDSPTAPALDHPMSIAVIDPSLRSLRSALDVLSRVDRLSVQSLDYYPSNPMRAQEVARQAFDVLLVNIENAPAEAFASIETITRGSSTGVIGYARNASTEMLSQAMRVGMREFLNFPLDQVELTRAIQRFVPRDKAASTQTENGNLYLFLSAKGGSGVTTVAGNFAAALAQSGESTALIDLDLPLGDAALSLGINAQYSTLDAINKGRYLDSSFLNTLLTKHECGLSVLSAPGVHSKLDLGEGAADRLVSIARTAFKHTIIDAGSHWSWLAGPIFETANQIYLVTQVGIPELRNANRVITGCLADCQNKLEIVMNRFDGKSSDLEDEAINKALTRPVSWRIPSDYVTVKAHQNNATPLALEDSSVSQIIQRMARKAAGQAEAPEKKKRFSLFGRN